ncbi:DUF6318 family protein [Nocardioides tweenelious]|uniref:DUF6318 family protein n=1 Tax=Nocardioides tweenelious TaxID=3156607 RepID=UPI003CCDAA5F
MPAAAKARSDGGAEAFVRYWVAMVNFAQSTGETTSLKSLNEPACSGCRGLVKAIDSAYAEGGRIEGGAWSISNLRKLPLDYGAEWAAFSAARTQPQTVVSDQQTKHFEGGPFQFYAYVDWDDGWRMRWLRTPTPS